MAVILGFADGWNSATRSCETVETRGMHGKAILTTDDLMGGAIPPLPDERQTALSPR